MVSEPDPGAVYDPLEARSVDELKRLGSYREVRRRLQDRVGERLQLRARGWNDLYAIVDDLRAGRRAYEDPTSRDGPRGPYFVSRAAEVTYALLHLDGDAKVSILGVTPRHFGDARLAKAWRDDLIKLIHPDRCGHPHAGPATAALNADYDFMTAPRTGLNG